MAANQLTPDFTAALAHLPYGTCATFHIALTGALDALRERRARRDTAKAAYEKMTAAGGTIAERRPLLQAYLLAQRYVEAAQAQANREMAVWLATQY